MANILIESVTFNPAPTNGVNVIFKYRKDSDVTWILLNGGVPVVVPITGILSAPISITGLDAATMYNVSAQTTCGTAQRIIDFTTAAETCPNITDIDGIITN
jgi:hypothetical protein